MHRFLCYESSFICSFFISVEIIVYYCMWSDVIVLRNVFLPIILRIQRHRGVSVMRLRGLLLIRILELDKIDP